MKLLDFGLAKLTSGNSGVMPAPSATMGEQATVAALTGAHTVVGTPQYMAPEQIEAREVDARTDIFAFGCVLYELLTGQRAFDGKTSSSIMAAVLATKPRPIEELVPLTPPALERIVSRCLAKDPEDRWQTARDVAAELQWVGRVDRGSACRRSSRDAGARARASRGPRARWRSCLAAGFACRVGEAGARAAPVVRFPLLSPPGTRIPARQSCRQMAGTSRLPPTATASGSSGCVRSTRSRPGRCPGPRACCGRSGHPTAAFSRSWPAAS